MASLSLKVNRSLLDPNFEGYKLSLDALPTYKHVLTKGPHVAVQSETQFSLQHCRIFNLHNHLYSDPWQDDHLYYVSEAGAVIHVKFEQFGFQEPHEVLHLSKKNKVVGEYNESIHFTSPHQVIIGDGSGTLIFAMTEDRSNLQEEWKVVFSGTIENDSKPFIIIHSRLTNQSEIECLLLSSEEHNREMGDCEGSSSGRFNTMLKWITLSPDKSENWTISRIRQLSGIGAVEYAVLFENEIYIASNHRFAFTYDSAKPLQTEVVTTNTNEIEYLWAQSKDDVTIIYSSAKLITKDDLEITFTPTHLNISLRDGTLLLSGEFFSAIDAHTSTWTFENNKLQILLMKATAETWQTLLAGNNKGKEITDASLLSESVPLLQHLASENPVFDLDKPAYDPNELEECDAFPSDMFNLSIYDGESHKLLIQVNLSGNQWLFCVQLSPTECPAFCIRHDVDGVVWQPGNHHTFNHQFTLNALGYVQASKQGRKFSTCSPDGSFAVISDLNKHLYVYHRPNPISSQIRNRRTGHEVASVARQQVINLDTTEEIIGIYASKRNIYLMTKSILFAVCVYPTTEL